MFTFVRPYCIYTYNPQKDLFSEKYTRDYTRTSAPAIIHNNVKTVNDAVNNNYRLSVDYRISDTHDVGLQVGGQYTDNNISIDGTSRLDGINLKRPMWYCYAGLDMNLPWKLNLTANIGYYTKGVANVFTANPMFRMDAGLSRRFINDKLKVSLSWNDIFHSAEISSYSSMSNRTLHYSFYNDQSFVQLAVSFTINDIKAPSAQSTVNDNYRDRIKGL